MIPGVEFDGQVLLSATWNLGGGISYVKAEWDGAESGRVGQGLPIPFDLVHVLQGRDVNSARIPVERSDAICLQHAIGP